MTSAEQVLAEMEAARRAPARLRLWLIGLTVVAFYIVAWHLAGVDLSRLTIGLPKIAHWIGQAWPP